MSGRKIPPCDCGQPGWHRIGNEWECEKCQVIRTNEELDRQIHPQDYVYRYMDGEQWSDSVAARKEYHREYNKHRVRHDGRGRKH
jgi:hypothetical protein